MAADADGPAVLVDGMCGTLATSLRMCGYDAASALGDGAESTDWLAARAREMGQTLLTRNRDLATL